MNLEDVQFLVSSAHDLNLQLTEEQVEKFVCFTDLLLKWNDVYNLTAITDPKEIIIKHYLDSLSVCSYIPNGACLDIGCGAGFPSIPLAILLPDRRFMMLDSNGKKTRFVKHAIAQLELPHCFVEQTRIEQFQPPITYSAIVCRAFAPLADIVRMTERIWNGETLLLAMKGLIPTSELNELPNDVVVDSVNPLEIPNLNAERHLVILRRRILRGEDIGNDQSEGRCG